MAVLQDYICTETELYVGDIWQYPAQHHALMEWLRFHDVDPMRIPMQNFIVRNVEACRVEYAEYLFDSDGVIVVADGEGATRPAFAQGETPPMPWPEELTMRDESEGDRG